MPRMVLAGAAASFGAAAMLLGGGRRGEHRGARIAVALGLAAGVVAGLSFLPLPASIRAGLQPGVSGPVSDALALTAQAGAARPLALDPGRGLVEWAVYLAMVLVVGGTAAVVRNRSRARRLATVVVLTGVCCVALGLAQRWTDASSILWWSGFPRHDDRAFFATFIDPNHAGVLMAAGAPLAVALVRDRVANTRLVGALGVLLLVLGTLLSGSRGGAVLLALGVVVALSLSGGRRLRLALAATLSLAVAAIAFIGPQVIVTWLTGALDPTQQATVAAGYGDIWGGRAQLYGNVWNMVDVAPWLGVGPGGFDDAWRVLRSGTGFNIAEHAHQELLQAIIEHGVLASCLALAAAGFVVRAALRPATDGGRGLVRLQAGFAGALAVVMGASLYEFPLRAGALSTLAALCAGAILGLARPAGRPGGRRARVVLAGSTYGLVAAALLVRLCAWATDQGVFADADVSILEGRQVQAAAGIDRGESWVEGGDPVALQEAARAFQDALWRRPVDRIALQELARVRYRQGRREDAQRALVVATDVYPSLPWPWADLARVRRASGDDYGAWEAWSMALAYDLPADFDLRPWLVEALQGPGGVDVAALAALPPRADRWVAAAQMVETAGDIEESEVLFKEAIALSPKQRPMYALALLRWGRPAEVLDLLPEDVAACGELLARSESLRRLARCEEALQVAQRSLSSCGAGDRSARLLVAQGRLCLGDDRAVGILEALLEEDPSNPAPRRALAHELARLGRTTRALRQLAVLEKAGQLGAADRELQARLRR